MDQGERSENSKLQEQPARRPSHPTSDKRGKSPLGASDDNIRPSQASSSQHSRQSLLSKLTRPDGANLQTTTKKEVDETECDTNTISGLRTQTTKIDLESSSSSPRNTSNNVDPPTATHQQQQQQQQQHKPDEQSDDDNQVVPLWPSKADAASRSRDFVQHKVYSLKDYSQVASPTQPTMAPSRGSEKKQSSSGSRKLLKSMSQERKMLKGAATKRMSECIYPPPGAAHLGQQSMDANTGLPSIQSQSRGSYAARGNQATSVEHHLMAAESRIDRVRKLFVSPLSLRSGHHHQQRGQGGGSSTAAALQNPRLSFQSTGESMLNKPHHLMHAMYRHHNQRRSPMRPGQLNSGKAGKSFRVYGCPLQLANNIYPITCFGRADIYKQQSVPYVLARLCNYIEENSCKLTHEGIFRVSGNARLMEKLRTLFDHLGDAPLESESVDVATSASMLKMYLRELPEPLIPTRMNYYFIALAKKYSLYLASEQMSGTGLNHHGGLYQSAKQQLLMASSNATHSAATNSSEPSTSGDSGHQAASNMPNQSLERQRLAFSRDLTKLVRKLPIENYNLLKYLACFLYRISLKQKYNKMCSEALGIVFGPNIFRIRSESYKGLKEQELSNQIMASIISNYKNIFDSDVTDPLGNLVDQSSTEEPEDCLIVAGQEPVVVAAGEIALERDEQVPVTPSIVSPTAEETPADGLAETGPDRPGKSHRGPSACCKEHCPHYLLDEGAEYNEAGQDDLQDADEDDEVPDGDDDECDGESYTPSTGSGSYCSSMDSESLESLYGDELDDELDSDERYDYDEEEDEDDLDDDIDMISRSDSSSDCASDTSYTPTSSRSDENDIVTNDGKPAGEDKVVSTDKGDSPGADLRVSRSVGERAQDNCSVCKRRQSLVNGDKSQPTILDSSVGQQQEQIFTSERRPLARRRRRSAANNKTKVRAQMVPVGQPAINLALGEQGKEDSSARLESSAAGSSRAPRRSPRFFRRRSSSASSLGRVRHRRDQQVVQQRRHAGEEAAQSQQSRVGARVSTGEHQVRRRARHFSVRRPQGSSSSRIHRSQGQQDPLSRSIGSSRSGHRMRARQAQDEPEVCKQQVATKRAATADELMNRGGLEQHDAEHTADSEELFAPWASYLAELDFDRYCLLRSFNSDETLLRSFNYCTEFASGSAAAEQMPVEEGKHSLTRGHSRKHANQTACRRFSGYEAGESAAALVQVCPPCEQIHEAYEEDMASLAAETNAALTRPPVGQHPELASSYVSLLDGRLNSLGRKFEFSVHPQQPSASQEDVQAAQDAILSQMKATKDLIRALRRLLKRGTNYKDYTDSMESLIMGLSEDSATRANAYSDDPSSCYVDHLAARGLVDKLDGLSLDEDEHLSSVCGGEQLTRLERLNGQLSVKITLFKQRYNDLKGIHDHYMQNHFQQTQAAQPEPIGELDREIDTRAANPAISGLVGLSDGQWKFHGSLDTLQGHSLSACSAASSRRSSHQARKLSAPNKRAYAPGAEPTSISQQQQPRCSPINDQCRPSVPGGQIAQSGTGRPMPAASVAKSRLEEQQQTRLHKLAHHMTQSANCSAPSVDRPSTAAVESGCKYGLLCPIEFVFNIEKQLASKRISAGRLVKLTEMGVEQLQAEKLELQKNLLRYEHWFGRPVTRLEFGLVGHLYERYRAVKLIKQRKLEAASGNST